MEPRDYELELLKQKLESLQVQVSRHTSHFESERDHVKEHGTNISLLLKQIDKLNSTVYENGKGLVQRVLILEHDKKESKSTWVTIISVLGLLTSIAAVIIMILK